MRVEPQQRQDIVIEPVDLRSVSDADIERLNSFGNIMQAESEPEEPPMPLELTRANVRNLPEVIAIWSWWAREPDGSLAATGQVSYRRMEDNPHAVSVSISVRPDRRRRGLAKALLRLAVDRVEQEGRTLVLGGTGDRVPAGEAFARRVGAEVGLAGHVNRLVLAHVDRDLARRWVEDGPVRATDYSLVMVDGACPDGYMDDYVELYDVMNTAPRDDLELEDMHWTADHLRQFERMLEAMGTEMWTLFARHDLTGKLVGFTEVNWNAKKPYTVGQGNTGVHTDHRGHALGKWLKAAMLERVLAERPGAEDIRTGNADSNDAMLGINHQLGFAPYIAWKQWQVKLDKIRAYLASGT